VSTTLGQGEAGLQRHGEELCAQLLDLVLAATGGRAEADATVDVSTLALTRFAGSAIHQNVADTAPSVRLRVHLDGRTASAATSRTSPDALEAVVEQALAAAALLPEDTGWAGLAPPAEVPRGTVPDAATASAPPGARAGVVRSFVDATAGLEAAGMCRTTHVVSSYASTTGHRVSRAATSATVDGIARTDSSDGLARRSSTRLADLDGAALGARAAAKARAGAEPVELGPGTYEVVLEPDAVADLLLFLAVYGFNGRAVAEGRSFVELGAQQLDPALTIVDDGTATDALGLPFDAEGTPKRRLEIVGAGVTRSAVHDRRTARELGTESTGHAVEGGERWGALPLDLALLPAATGAGGAAHPAVGVGGAAGLVAGMRRGLLVTDLWYTRVLDPRTLVVTGLTRNGVWLVEDGQVVRPVSNLRFTQSYVDALAPGAVLGVGGEAETVPQSWGPTGVRAPALHLARWHVTGGASG